MAYQVKAVVTTQQSEFNSQDLQSEGENQVMKGALMSIYSQAP